MATILHSGVSSPSPCPYLADRNHQMNNLVMIDVPPVELDHLLRRGWRRFGPHYFRPACLWCQECISTRIPVAEFQPSKSQRRAWRKCAGIEVRYQLPQIDDARLELYEKWHTHREATKGWPPNPLDEEGYRRQFCYPHPCARELAYYEAGRLIGIGIVDETPEALSSIYFFYSPEFDARSLGIASVLYEIEIAKQRGRKFLYLGYYVRGCGSLEYKSTFSPYEILASRPDTKDIPVWIPVQSKASK